MEELRDGQIPEDMMFEIIAAGKLHQKRTAHASVEQLEYEADRDRTMQEARRFARMSAAV